MRIVNRTIVLAALLSGAAACSGGSSTSSLPDGSTGLGNTNDSCKVDGFTGLVACSAPSEAGSPPFCQLSMPTQGGIVGPLCEGQGLVICGSGHNDTTWLSLDWFAKSPSSGGRLDTQVVIRFTDPVAVDQLGIFSAAIEITQTLPNDGGKLVWKTPPSACAINLAGSVCSKTQHRVLSGTGSCSEPAAPEPGTSAAPITIGEFSFNGS